jgi:hypothetical protein
MDKLKKIDETLMKLRKLSVNWIFELSNFC